ncbi:MAG TPA: hypothetical protein PLP90_04920 [Methanoculleus sp.]|nr:hypothetical protein [Methanoculleus sp.]
MTGEMGWDDLKEYPDMMALTKTLKRNDFDAQMLPFDVYQGPYIFVNGVGAKVWHHEVGGRWLVEMGRRGNNGFSGPLTSREVVQLIKQLAGRPAIKAKSSQKRPSSKRR